MELFNTYLKEINIDTQLDQLNIIDKQLKQPAVRHKWVSRLMLAKKSLNTLKKKKRDIRKSVMEALYAQIPKGIPKASLDLKIESSEKIQAINEEIENAELLVEYLDRVEKIFSSMTFDFSNLAKLIKMEES